MKNEKKWKRFFIVLAFVCFLGGFIISGIKIIEWKLDSNKTNKQIEDVQKDANIEEKEDNENTEIIEPAVEVPITDPYWDYIKMNMIDVDFNKLKDVNNDIKGWILVNGTNVNYPFVQTDNNSYYLKHSFDKSYNTAGWLFLDYRNNDTDNKNTIIYGHGRYDKTMFGTLRDILESNWVNNKDNYIIKISTEKENTLWQIFSAYHIPTTSDYLQIDFKDDDEFQEFVNKLKNRSAYNFDTTVSKNDKILTLSTCYSNQEKMVIHAKLIKKETKI